MTQNERQDAVNDARTMLIGLLNLLADTPHTGPFHLSAF